MAELPRFLDPQVLSRISPMELRARAVVEGFIAGLHKSPFKGFSVEFAEYRQYSPGDDIRMIDWKAYARSDRYYVKEFEDETNLKSYILLDRSASMGYRSNGISKLEYASYLAAALALFISHQRDGVGLITFDREVTNHFPTSSRRSHSRSVHSCRICRSSARSGYFSGGNRPNGKVVPDVPEHSDRCRRRCVL